MKLKMFAIIGALCAVSASAEVKRVEIPGAIGGYVSCIGQTVVVSGTGVTQIQTLEAQNNTLVSIHGQAKLEGADASGRAYKATFKYNANFGAKSTSYTVPYNALFIGHGNTPNFRLDGEIKLFVDANGNPIGGAILSGTITCVN
ncbi:MAG: hypothetical protein FJW38_07540 [Acidobacteria bacterium]|nr:hypothetical protein [Acidobacteriota bacterium]